MDANTVNNLPNHVGTTDDPVNIAIMDVDAFIQKRNALPVTSSLTMEPSTNSFHAEGLYSEHIFGYVGSPDRLERFGYLDLNTMIINPKIFKLMVQLGSLYHDIMKGSAHAVFDYVTKNFKRVTGDPLDTPGADTGYSFFLKHLGELSFATTTSSKRDERIGVIEQYKDQTLMVRYLVEPAGLRDLANDSSGRLVQDDINKLYTSLLMYTRAIPKGSQSPLYDSVRYQIQSKGQEIYEYLENFLDGKRGFIQGNFARRKVAMGTRNVITAAPFMAASPQDPQLLQADDVMVGVYQTSKGLQPFFKHILNTIFIHPIFKTDTVSQIALSDPKTGLLTYTAISPATRDAWTSSEGIEKMINSYRNTDLRDKPVLIPNTEGKLYALCFVYDEGDEIAICRSIEDLQAKWPRPIHKDKLRPITYTEMFYLVADTASVGKHGICTRYPVIEQGSSYPAQIHVVSTTPARCVDLVDILTPDLHRMTLKQYPVLGASHMDAMMVHPSKMAALGADHDGDVVLCVITR